jgi:SM-20-related protein
MFENIEVENLVLPNPYVDYPYMIIKNFLSKDLATHIVDEIISTNNKIEAKVKKLSDIGGIEPKVDKKQRVTNIYKLNSTLESIYEENFNYHKKNIEEFFGVALTFSSKLQVLEYKEGFYYKKHADDSSELIDLDGNIIGFKNVAPYRKITAVLFASEFQKEANNNYSFDGGELKFNYLFDKDGNSIILRPKSGDMVLFPSNPYFSHEVMPVKSGYRLSLVKWFDAIIS